MRELTPTSRRMNLRVDVLQPSNDETATGNTRGLFFFYGSRYAGRLSQSGANQFTAYQDVGSNTINWLMRFDASLKPGWVLRLGTSDYFIESIVPDEVGFAVVSTTKRESLVTISRLVDTFTGAAGGINGTLSDSGHTRTVVAGSLSLNGSGQATGVGTLRYSGVAANGSLVVAFTSLADDVTIYFNANAALTSCWFAFYDRSEGTMSLFRRDASVDTLVATVSLSVVDTTMTVYIDGDRVRTSLGNLNYSVNARPYKMQTAVAVATFGNPLDSVTMQ